MEARSLARPYAKAAFEYASQNKCLLNWSVALSIWANVVSQPSVISLLKNPQCDTKKLANLLTDIKQPGFLDESLKNLIRILAEKHRLMILPELFQLFEEYRTAYEKTVQTRLISAYPISLEQQAKLATALKIRLQRDVTIETHIDPTLIGGAIITVGDLVIDGSVKNTLSRLLNHLC